jgi:hypothetical protein
MASSKTPAILQIKPGTPEMEAHLQAGYKMSIEEAKRLISERKSNPAAVPYEVYSQAVAMVEGYSGKPEVISKTPGWKRKDLRRA